MSRSTGPMLQEGVSEVAIVLVTTSTALVGRIPVSAGSSRFAVVKMVNER